MDITYFSLEDANFCLNFNLSRKNGTKQIQLQPVLSDPWQPQCVRLSLWSLPATSVLPGKYHQKYKQSYLNYMKAVSFWGNNVFWKRRRRLLHINTNVSLISKIYEDALNFDDIRGDNSNLSNPSSCLCHALPCLRWLCHTSQQTRTWAHYIRVSVFSLWFLLDMSAFPRVDLSNVFYVFGRSLYNLIQFEALHFSSQI